MNLTYGDAAARGLRRYVNLVSDALGLGTDVHCLQLDDPVGAYLPLDRRVPGLPDRDAALLWDEQQGWFLAVESSCGEDLLVISYFGAELLPEPAVVADYVADFYAGRYVGHPEPQDVRHTPAEDIARWLAEYASPTVTHLSVVKYGVQWPR